VTDTHHHTELSFVDEFRRISPLHYLKKWWQTLFYFGACCKRSRHLYTTTAPSCWVPASSCHLSATLQTMSIIVVNLRDNRAVFRNFIALLLKFSFDSPSYIQAFPKVKLNSLVLIYGHRKRKQGNTVKQFDMDNHDNLMCSKIWSGKEQYESENPHVQIKISY
jgi:hypothetical protein